MSQQRFRGCLLGLAAGDALGTTLEFRQPGTFLPIRDMVGGGPFHLKPGEWTDDTSMALCLGESLVACQGFNPADQMQRYVRWHREGYLSANGRCFDIGITVFHALNRFERTGEPYSGSTDPMSAGNGSIMRLAPVPMFYSDWIGNPRSFAAALDLFASSSRTTHGAQAAVDACRYFGALLVGALNGETKEKLLGDRYTPAPGYWEEHPLVLEIDEVASGSFKRKKPPEIQGSGYVVRSLEAALWAFYHSGSFKEGCLAAVNLGNDADTTGAIYGQLAGAYYGLQNIPESWRSRIAREAFITALADQLFAMRRPVLV